MPPFPALLHCGKVPSCADWLCLLGRKGHIQGHNLLIFFNVKTLAKRKAKSMSREQTNVLNSFKFCKTMRPLKFTWIRNYGARTVNYEIENKNIENKTGIIFIFNCIAISIFYFIFFIFFSHHRNWLNLSCSGKKKKKNVAYKTFPLSRKTH